MHKTEGAGMQRLTGTYLKAILDKLAVFGRALAAEDLVATVAGVGQQRVAYMLHVNAYLMRAPCFEATAYHRRISQTFHHLVVGHGMLAIGEHGHLEAVLRIAAHIPDDGAHRRIGHAPHHSHIFAAGGLFKKLAAEIGLGIGRLGHHE